MTLSFEQFKTRVSNEILNYLPEEFQNAEVKISTMQKLGDSYIALTLPRENNEANNTELQRCFYTPYSVIRRVVKTNARIIKASTI